MKTQRFLIIVNSLNLFWVINYKWVCLQRILLRWFLPHNMISTLRFSRALWFLNYFFLIMTTNIFSRFIKIDLFLRTIFIDIQSFNRCPAFLKGFRHSILLICLKLLFHLKPCSLAIIISSQIFTYFDDFILIVLIILLLHQ